MKIDIEQEKVNYTYCMITRVAEVFANDKSIDIIGRVDTISAIIKFLSDIEVRLKNERL